MFEVDGGQRSGSGTILRLSVALAVLRRQPLHIYNIRQKRPQPGLKAQHLEAVLTAARLCDAEVKGVVLGSKELWFTPKMVKGGNYEAEIGTAGSIPMLLLTILPICAFAQTSIRLHVSKGGTDTWSAPTINYIRFVLLPTLQKMGLNCSISIQRYGYYPKGMGEVTFAVEPVRELRPLRLEGFGDLQNIRGYSVCTFLAEQGVAKRQANAAQEYLSAFGHSANIEIVNDTSNPLQKGSSIVLWAETSSGVIIGADAIGELGKPSEVVGREAAGKLVSELLAKSTVDKNLADMLIPYVALSNGASAFLTKTVSDHLEANIWLAETMLGVKFSIEKTNGLFIVKRLD